MNKALRFFSIATVTQVLLAMHQLVLLPLQLREWGSATTASWNVALAAAGMLLIADLGLRTTGHSAFLRFLDDASDRIALAEFERSWTGIRLLSSILGIALLAVSVLWWSSGGGVAGRIWPTLLVVAVWLEALMIARIMYLDTAGRYVLAEAAYTLMLVCRLLAAVVGLVVFGIGPLGLAAIHVAAAAAAIAIQGVCARDLPCLSLWAPLRPGPLRQLVSLARYSAAEPLSQWLRVNLPVLVLGSMAAPALITSYVALRAIFGPVRNLVQQVARYTSIEDVRDRRPGEASRRAPHRRLITAAITVLATTMGLAIIADHLRLLGRLLPGLDLANFSFLAACFAFPGAFVAYQLVQARLMREGRTAVIARRQYVYVAIALGVAAIGYRLGNPSIYLPSAAGAELCLALMFLALDRSGHVLKTILTATCGCVAVAGLVSLVEHSTEVFAGHSFADLAVSLVALAALLATLVAITALFHRIPARRKTHGSVTGQPQ